MKFKFAAISMFACLLGGALFAAQPDYNLITYTISGTLAPNLNSGPDCLMWNNQVFTVMFNLSPFEAPVSSSKNSATYPTLATVSAGTYTNNSVSVDVTFTLTPHYNSIRVTGMLQGLGPLIANTVFAPGSLEVGVLQRPKPLVKGYNPQPLQPPGSFLGYQAPSCAPTKLGISGTLATATS